MRRLFLLCRALLTARLESLDVADFSRAHAPARRPSEIDFARTAET